MLTKRVVWGLVLGLCVTCRAYAGGVCTTDADCTNDANCENGQNLCIAGTCTFVQTGACVGGNNPGTVCSRDSTCTGSGGDCVHDPRICRDGNSCTTDSCITSGGDAGDCSNIVTEVCGNGTCNTDCEDCESCPADCGCDTCTETCDTSGASPVCVTTCGDGTCDADCENCSLCLADCACDPCAETCNMGLCQSNCGDGNCDAACEDCDNCPFDCGCTPCTETCDTSGASPECVITCGDGFCDTDCENCTLCPDDCACEQCTEICNTGICESTCGDGFCDTDCEDCDNCSADCGCAFCTEFCDAGACVPACGDGTCDPNCEDCDNCETDCGCDACTEFCKSGVCIPTCGDTTCDTDCEDCDNCPFDCPCDPCTQTCDTGVCVSACGDGTCDMDCEDCGNCEADCACGPCNSCVNGVCEPDCGNGTCDPACEDCNSCPLDCTCTLCTQVCNLGVCVSTCGDGFCDPDCEDCGNCPADCACVPCSETCSVVAAVPFPGCVPTCGDGTCDPGCEDCGTCPADCGCDPCTHCDAGSCVSDCGDGICDPACFEDCSSCDTDCVCEPCTETCMFTVAGADNGCVPTCGDGVCNPDCENCTLCPADCACTPCTQACVSGMCMATCGDGMCDPLCENCDNCLADCGCLPCEICQGGGGVAAIPTCVPLCGNGICDPACENCTLCPADCACLPCTQTCNMGMCEPSCGDGTCDPGCEDCANCQADCGCNPCTETCSVTAGGDGGCVPTCGNGACDPACENCDNCAADCGCNPCEVCNAGVCELNCDDGLGCNGVETCDPVNGCQPGTPPICNDSIGCTMNSCENCDPATDTSCLPARYKCVFTPDDTRCDDGVACNGEETCLFGTVASSGCQAGTPPNCSDGAECSADTCEECDPATDPHCQLAGYKCVHRPDDSDAGNINLTTGVNDGTSMFIPVGGADDTWTVTCEATPNGALPRPATVITPHPEWDTIMGSQWISANYEGPNGNYCYQSCFCLAAGFQNPSLTFSILADDAADVYLNNTNGHTLLVTRPSVPAAYDLPATTFTSNGATPFAAGVNCIEVVVHELGGMFTGFDLVGRFTATNAKCNTCDDGAFCDGEETCACATAECCSLNNSCSPASPTNPSACTSTGGSWACTGFACAPGTPPTCDETPDLGCTVDTCNPALAACMANQDAASCCVHTPVNCSDNIGCTGDTCMECPAGDATCLAVGHRCVHTPNHGFCQNGLGCDGQEVCNPAAPPGTGCQDGMDPICNDSIACTIDTCRECATAGSGCENLGYECVFTPNVALCGNGTCESACENCNTCPDDCGCQPAEPPCEGGEMCNIITGQCDDLPDAPPGTPCEADGDILTGDACNGGGLCIQGSPIPCPDPFVCPSGEEPFSRISIDQKGSLLIFSKIEIKWGEDGALIQDTFLDITNDYPNSVTIQGFFINGDVELEQLCDDFPCTPGNEIQHFEPGWNTADCRFTLTANQPHYWSAATGSDKCQPFVVLDEDGPGRPDPETGGDTRVLRGYAVFYAVRFNPALGEDGGWEEIRWNHLKGDAVLVNYANGTAWEYNAWAAQAHCSTHGAPLLDCTLRDLKGTCCTAEVIPGRLDLDGFQYDIAFDDLLLDFYGSGSDVLSGGGVTATVDTDLTVHAVSADLRQDGCGPVLTKVEAEICNEFESCFSGTRRCVCCWDQTMLSNWVRSEAIPNHFMRSALRTDKGKARLDGVHSNECDFEELCGPTAFQKMWNCRRDSMIFGDFSEDAAILGLATKFIAFSGPSSERATAGMNLVGTGEERATILVDTDDGTPELSGEGHQMVRPEGGSDKASPRTDQRPQR